MEYSEEELKKLLKDYFYWQFYNDDSEDLIDEWIEQHKKKI